MLHRLYLTWESQKHKINYIVIIPEILFIFYSKQDIYISVLGQYFKKYCCLLPTLQHSDIATLWYSLIIWIFKFEF